MSEGETRILFTDSSRRSLEIKFDWITALLIVLLIATLIAFFTGVLPYPVGWIVLAALLVFRLTARSSGD